MEYKITEEQVESIYDLKRGFEYNASLIKNLCASEKDDVVYGFELGEIHSNLRDCFVRMMELEEEIKNQECKSI
jgi:hypothetical protein